MPSLKYLAQTLHAIVVLCITLLVGFALTTTAQAAMPDGFTDEVVASGLNLPTTFDFAPDGRIFVAEKGGTIRIVKNGKLLPDPFYTVPAINTKTDRGLLGLVLDPNFENNGWVYLSYTYENSSAVPYGPKMAQIIRVKAAGDVALPDTVEVLVGSEVGDAAQPSCNDYATGTDCIPSDSGSHSAGGLRFGPDGMLYATLGDGAGFVSVDENAYKAQRLDWLTGKVLRLNTDGTAPVDNPFYTGNPNENRSKVFAYGVRNSFRFDFRESTGALYAGDVGWGAAEEVNVIRAGDNLGWPCREGLYKQGSYDCEAEGYDDSIYSYIPVNGAVAVTGGGFAGSAYPSEYQDSYFFGDFHRSDIYRMIVDENDEMVSLETWHDGSANGPVSILPGLDGSIYYVAIFTGELRQLVHDSMRDEQTPPVANNDEVVTVKNTPVTIAALENDTDINNDSLSIADLGLAANGTVVIVADNELEYTPNTDFVGTDSFTYTVTDGISTDSAIVTVVVREGGDSSAVDLVHVSAGRDLPAPVVGEVVTFTTIARNDGAEGPILVNFELHNLDTGTRVAQEIFDNESLPAGVSTPFSFDWLPGRAGRYRLDIGYFHADWQEMHQWVHNAMTFTVYDRELSTEPFTLSIDNIEISDLTPEIGDTVSVTVRASNSGAAGTGLIISEIYVDGEPSVKQSVYEDVLFAEAETKQFTFDWIPTAAGQFYIDAGSFGADWNPLMDWSWRGASVSVTESTNTGAQSVFLYDDSLSADWNDWSWGTSADFGFSALPVVSGSAIAVEHAEPWAGFFLRTADPLAVAGLQSLSFDIMGVNGGGQAVQVLVIDSTDTFVIEEQLAPLDGGWETVSLDLSSLAPGVAIRGLIIQDRSNESGTRYLLDNIVFE